MTDIECRRCNGTAINPEDSHPGSYGGVHQEPPALEPCRDCSTRPQAHTQIRERHQAAAKEVHRLAESGDWRMTVPVREDYDSDTVLTASLSDIPILLAEVERLVALTAGCACSQGPDAEGPSAECPVHGAVRGMHEAHARITELEEQRATEDEIKHSLRRRMVAAINARDEAMIESARAYSQGVEDMRAKVTDRIFADEQECQKTLGADPTSPHLNGRLAGLQRARDIATGAAP